MIVPEVRGPGAVAALCLRCLAVLAGVNVLALGVATVVMGRERTESELTIALVYLPYVLAVAAVLIAVVGFPAGLLTAHLLVRARREWVHVLTFALVGGVLSVAICASWGLFQVVGWFALIAAAEGVVGAGVARWWTGRAHARRSRWSDDEGAALPWGRIGA